MSVVLLADAKAQLNIEPGFTNDDTLIQEMIDAAEDWITKFVVAPTNPSCAPDPCLPANPITTWPPSPVPPSLLQAIRLLVAHLYENREASLVSITSQELPFGLMDLIAPYRVWTF